MELYMGELQSDGATRREHLESVARQMGSLPPELAAAEAVQCPAEMEYLWQHFASLNRRRRFGDSGMPEPISSAEMRAWADLRRISLAAWEVDVIDRIEDAFFKRLRESIAARKKEQPQARSKGR